MIPHLLLFTLGPVQEFIAQARRTRDLWHGSHLLSELSRAAARALVDGEAQLVFPALEKGHPELAPCPGPLRPDGTPPLNVANKLLAHVPEHVDPRTLARDVRAAVNRFWRDEIAAGARRRCGGLLDQGIDAAWDEQIETFLEISAAWAPLRTPGEHGSARQAVEQAITARKGLHDFQPWRHLRGGVPKSSLDGGRETVLRHPNTRDPKLVRKYRVSNGENLDAVGLVKRAGGEPEQFVPIFNIALAPWLSLARQEAPARLNALAEAGRKIGLSRVQRSDLPVAKDFSLDAGILLRSRWRAIFAEMGVKEDPQAWGRQHVQPLLDLLTEPHPYVACLVADGDRMGRLIDAIPSAEAHRDFSRGLSSFATDARQIVEQEHSGSLVYAGGDDVLAFLPLTQALECADALRRRFAEVVVKAAGSALAGIEPPTLSVGLGVGHVMESMGHLLGLGRAAESLAKAPRNALAVLVDKRSGDRRWWRARWDERGEVGPVRRLREDQDLLDQQLSSRKVYEIQATLSRLPRPAPRGEDPKDPAWARLLALEVQRSLARAHSGETEVDLASAGLSLDVAAGYAALHAEVSSWVNRMLVAGVFAAASPRLRRNLEEEAAA
jgi:CRISPR-associated protein Cmr2